MATIDLTNEQWEAFERAEKQRLKLAREKMERELAQQAKKAKQVSKEKPNAK